MKLTQGTETSKYPEEKKSIEISLVAASEKEIVQSLNPNDISKTTWEGWP